MNCSHRSAKLVPRNANFSNANSNAEIIIINREIIIRKGGCITVSKNCRLSRWGEWTLSLNAVLRAKQIMYMSSSTRYVFQFWSVVTVSHAIHDMHSICHKVSLMCAHDRIILALECKIPVLTISRSITVCHMDRRGAHRWDIRIQCQAHAAGTGLDGGRA